MNSTSFTPKMSLLFYQYRWLSEYLSSITPERERCKRVYTELAEVKNSVIILCNIQRSRMYAQTRTMKDYMPRSKEDKLSSKHVSASK